LYSLSLVRLGFVIFWHKNIGAKAASRCQFHQHFMRVFFADILSPKNFKPKTQLCNFWRQNFVGKTLMKLTAD